MSCPPPPGRRLRRTLAVLAMAWSVSAVAQYPGGAVVQRLPSADDPAEKLAAALRTLASSPRNLGALIEAGRDALTLGDPNAAVGFFGRASEVSPRDGRVKAGLGAALVQLEKPRDALRYFQEAAALGVGDADLAADRGLAYDLVGDTARAQRDYRTVLAAHPDDEAARRRLALSQGIAGDRAGAIATLDPLIRKRDIAAWRAQTFVLAMTGDGKGANDITRVMLPQQQAMLQPFLERLATLSPADKARAVHFGEMPAAGRSYDAGRIAAIGTPPTFAAAPAPAPAVVRPATVPPPALASNAPAPTVAPSAEPRRTIVAAASSSAPAAPAQPRPSAPAAEPRYVSPDGTPMRRIEHSAQEMFALGVPRYEYVPAAGARAPARPVAPVVPPPSSARAVASVAGPAPSTSIAGPPAGTETPASGVTAPQVAAAPVTAPPSPATMPAVAVAGPPAVAMPLGASGSGGHFDLPHEIANRRAVPRSTQPTARAATVSAPRPAPSVAAAAPAEPDGADPIVGTARRARAATRDAVASADRPIRRRPASDPAEAGGDDATDTSTGSAPAKTDKRGRSGAALATKAADAATSPRRKSGHIAVADQDPDASVAGKSGRRSKARQPDAAEDDVTAKPAHDRETKRGGKADAARTDDHASARSAKDGAGDKAKAKDKAKDKGETARPAAAKVYVQVAGGANKADMDKAWAGVKAKAPDLMKGRKPSTTPLRATNRLLVGPFKDEDDAQAFVNKMAGKGLSGFTVRTGKGQKVETVDTAR